MVVLTGKTGVPLLNAKYLSTIECEPWVTQCFGKFQTHFENLLSSFLLFFFLLSFFLCSGCPRLILCNTVANIYNPSLHTSSIRPMMGIFFSPTSRKVGGIPMTTSLGRNQFSTTTTKFRTTLPHLIVRSFLDSFAEYCSKQKHRMKSIMTFKSFKTYGFSFAF